MLSSNLARFDMNFFVELLMTVVFCSLFQQSTVLIDQKNLPVFVFVEGRINLSVCPLVECGWFWQFASVNKLDAEPKFVKPFSVL